jgi:hypothetical protein
MAEFTPTTSATASSTDESAVPPSRRKRGRPAKAPTAEKPQAKAKAPAKPKAARAKPAGSKATHPIGESPYDKRQESAAQARAVVCVIRALAQEDRLGAIEKGNLVELLSLVERLVGEID